MNKRTRLLLFFAFVIIIIVASVVTIQETNRPTFPESFGLLTIEHRLGKQEAADLINRLHGKGIAPEHNEVVFYSSQSGTATLYLSVYSKPNDARNAEERMAQLIRNGNPVFGEYNKFIQNGLVVHRCFGLQQEHFFFLSKNLLYWIAIDPPIARQSLDAFLETL